MGVCNPLALCILSGLSYSLNIHGQDNFVGFDKEIKSLMESGID